MSTALLVDEFIARQIAAWMRDLGSVRRLAPNTLEAYDRDLGQFFNFLGPHMGGPVSIETLREMRGADLRAFMAKRREDGVVWRHPAQAPNASFAHYGA